MSEIRMLRTFLAIENLGTMAAAADCMALTHAAVGAQMRTLERLCQRQLFDRSGRSAQLNEAGRLLLEQARAVVAAYDSLVRSVSGHQSIEGSITIGAPASSAGFLAANVLRLAVPHPGLKVQILVGESAVLMEMVRIGRLDAALVTRGPRATTLPESWEPLYKEPLVLLANPAMAPADASVASLLKRFPFVSYESELETGRHVTSLLRRLGVDANPALKLASVREIAQLVRQNLCVSIVPLLQHGGWSEDPHLFVKQIPGATWHRDFGWYVCGRNPLATVIVKNQLLATLNEERHG